MAFTGAYPHHNRHSGVGQNLGEVTTSVAAINRHGSN